jgi:hypothetical protein
MDMTSFHNEVLALKQRLSSYFVMPGDPIARALQNSFQKLEDELQMGKSVETVRNRLKEIERQLKPAYDAGVLNNANYDNLLDWVRDCLQKVR